MLPPSSPSLALAPSASSLLDVPSSGCLLPTLSLPPLPPCSAFVLGGALWLFFAHFLSVFLLCFWCDVLVALLVCHLVWVLILGVSFKLPLVLFCVCRRSPPPALPPTVRCWVFPHAPPVMSFNVPCCDGFPAS